MIRNKGGPALLAVAIVYSFAVGVMPARGGPLVLSPPSWDGKSGPGPAVSLSPVLASPRRDGGAGLILPPAVPVLFVTHAARRFDPRAEAKPGVDRAVAFFVRRGWPVVSLVDCSGEKGSEPYLKDRRSTTEVCSEMGEHSVRTGVRPLYFAGGFFEACSLETVESAVASALRERKEGSGASVEIHYVTDGVYASFLTGLGTLAQVANSPETSARMRALWPYLVRDLRDGWDRAVAALAPRLELTVRRGTEPPVLVQAPVEGPAIPVALYLDSSPDLGAP